MKSIQIGISILLSILTVVWLPLPPVFSADPMATWPQWRGPDRTGHVFGPAWPKSLQGERLRQLWRVEMGPSYSGPIVAMDRVFVTETKDKTDEVVYALDRKTGKAIWKTEWKGSLTVPFFAQSNGNWIRSTPAYDGDNLFVGGMRDVLVCLSAETGAERWRIDFVERFKSLVPAFGFVSSPLVHGDDVYVQAGASIVKIDKKSGSVLWRSAVDEGGLEEGAFSSPLVAKFGGKVQLVAQTRVFLMGLDTANGELLWKQPVPAFRGMNILTPTVYRNGLFTSCYGGRSFFYQVDEKNGAFTTAQSWSNKAQGFISTPVTVNGYAYLLLRNQRLICFELDTGKECWTSMQTFGKYWSMVAHDNEILALDERGILFLIKANSEKLEIIDERKISEEETWAHLAVCGDELFIRELNAIAAYRWSE